MGEDCHILSLYRLECEWLSKGLLGLPHPARTRPPFLNPMDIAGCPFTGGILAEAAQHHWPWKTSLCGVLGLLLPQGWGEVM